MSTYTTSTPVSNASSATLNTWIEEICNALVTECGLTQTADTGQIWSPNTATGVLSGSANTSSGYVILRFNDALQGSYPVFIKLEFGTGTATTEPSIWITVGTGSNGSGTLTGTVTTRVQTTNNQAILSPSSNYNSYFCYNSTYGTLFLGWKYGAFNASFPAIGLGGFYVFRGSTASGAANSDAVMCMSCGSAATGAGSSGAGTLQCINYAASAVYPATIGNGTGTWCGLVNGALGVQSATAALPGTASAPIFPASYLGPSVSFSNTLGICRAVDVNFGNTFSGAILGATSITYLSAGGAFGSEDGPGSVALGSNASGAGSICVVWE